ncbi:hypothetical protein DRZ78_03025 [Candidatus Aerophobetes bacterium]|uniref:EamA domain-containing protein n=1 Tax=Aerophobetes bacterium TaxID=2030807 RepID=A0A662CZJ0_UNCAE|nr:MAG: hypothetical protein DRZ78_03025 [Candidatus Aerophobetes bacterium]
MRPELLIFISVGLGVLGQLSMKQGMSKIGLVSFGFPTLLSNLLRIITAPFVLLGLFLYAISTIFWLVVLSRVDLSYAYPMISIGYVLILILSWALFNEHISSIRALGVLLICIGVFLISKS